ncbi:PTS sugar transporter subunit IIA [Clostridium paraputrificum]|uniref:PTS sugar transporter subunit IIA n=1 Tax=Clostridium paraputrificum TaxID=29363 RepID=UPI003D3391A4
MFNLFKEVKKEKNNDIYAIGAGKIIPLEEVPDEVFSQKMMGDGIAIELEDELVISPVNGKIISIFPTKHAIIIENQEGVEIIVHIGIDTVNLNGEGYELFIKEGEEVSVGSHLAKVDINLIKARGYSVITPILIANMDDIKNIDFTKNTSCKAREVIYSYKK